MMSAFVSLWRLGEMLAQVANAGADRLAGIAFHAPVAFEHVMAKFGQPGAAATAGAAFLGIDKRLGEVAIKLLNKCPTAFVAHAEELGGGRQRSGLVDGLEKIGLARPDRDTGFQNDAETKSFR